MSSTALPAQSMQYISHNSFSGASSVEFTGLSSGYFAYRFEFAKVTTSADGATINLRTSTDNGSSYDNGSSDYSWAYIYAYSGTADGDGATSDSAGRASIGSGNATNEACATSVILFNPSDTNYTCYTALSAGEYTDGLGNLNSLVGRRLSTTAVNAVSFFPSSGTFSGTVYVYGYTNA